MKTKLLLLGFLFQFLILELSFGQLTGIKNIPGDYATLALAITDLNLQGVGPGGVTINVTASQINPSGGYVIGGTGSLVLTTASASNPIIIQGNGNTITAPNPAGAAGALTDGIFKLIGADFVTINNFVLNENATNTTTAAASNNMVEFGIALLYATTTDGCQNNTFQNNTITLNRTYQNSFGIYSNTRHTATSATTTADITSPTGSNSNNKVYGNIISNVKHGIVFIGSTPANIANIDNGNDIGGASSLTGNSISNWGNATTSSTYVSLTTSNYCIIMNHQNGENVSYNTIVSAALTNGVTTGGIFKSYSAVSPAVGTLTGVVNYTFNTITVLNNPSTAATGTIIGISLGNITNLQSGLTIQVLNNTVKDCILGGAIGTATGITAIVHSNAVGTARLNNNTVNNNKINCTAITTGTLFGVANTGAASNIEILGNIVSNNYNLTATTTGTFIGITNQSGTATTTTSITSNTISSNGLNSPTLTGTGNVVGISNTPTALADILSIRNNTLEGFINSSTGQMQGVFNFAPVVSQINIINNIFGTATSDFFMANVPLTGTLFVMGNGGAGNANCSLNISNNTLRGIRYNVISSSFQSYINNQATTLKSQTFSGNVFQDLAINSTGSVTFLTNNVTNPAGGFKTINNNSISGTFTKLAAGGNVRVYSDFGLSPASVAVNNSNNNFSNISLTGNTIYSGWINQDGNTITDSPTKIFNNNVFSNIDSDNGTIIGALFNWNKNVIMKNNTFSNFTSTDSIYVVTVGGNSGQSTIDSNTINSILSEAGLTLGIDLISSNTAGAQISNNKITNLGGNNIIGIEAIDTVKIFNNVLCNLSTDTISSTVEAIKQLSGKATIYNNRISGLEASVSNGANTLKGIDIAGGTLTEIFYNSILLNGTSSSALFGSSVINANDAVNMILQNNVLINNAISQGAGLSVSLRRSGTNLATYNSASNNNDFVGSTLFSDGTTNLTLLGPGPGSLKDFLMPRESSSVSDVPIFLSTTCGANDLLKIDNTYSGPVSNGGLPNSISTDFENETRSATTPDMGADEFMSLCPLTVTSSLNSGVNSLRDVIACASTGSTITIDPSVTMIALSDTLDITGKTLTIVDGDLSPVMITLNSDNANITISSTATVTFNNINIKDLSPTKTNPTVINNGILNLSDVKISGDVGSTNSPTYKNVGTGSVVGNCQISNQ